jgi:hypothetical protein
MNGRVYDYNLGRFLSVDPLIQAPGNSQSLNPSSYIMNNPLAGTDPTGYASEKVEVEETDKFLKDDDGNIYLDQGGDIVIKVDSVSVSNGSNTTTVGISGSNGSTNITSVESTADIGGQGGIAQSNSSALSPEMTTATTGVAARAATGAVTSGVSSGSSFAQKVVARAVSLFGDAAKGNPVLTAIAAIVYSPSLNDGEDAALASMATMRRPSPTAMEKMMEAAGRAKPGAGYSPHHIVPIFGFKNLDNGLITDGMRSLLDANGIGINSPENIIWLPNKEQFRIPGDRSILHGVGHRHSTIIGVNQRIQIGAAAGGPNGIRAALGSIRADFNSGVEY